MTTGETTPNKEVVPKEIERKFVVDSLPEDLDINAFSGKTISQGYLVNSPESAVRVRRKGDKFFLTYKEAPKGHAAERVELETELNKDQFDTMWPGTVGRRLEKTRYEIPFGDHTIELDVFEGDNVGHLLAEVEFDSTTDADLFQAPEWFSQDVTADKRYGNSNIAEFGFPE